MTAPERLDLYPADELTLRRAQDDGHWIVEGLSEAEARTLGRLMYTLTPMLTEAVSNALATAFTQQAADIAAQTTRALTADLGAQVYEVARSTAEQVCKAIITAKVMTIERDANGDIVRSFTEPVREPGPVR